MVDSIVTPELNLTAEVQLALVNGASTLQELLSDPASNMGAILAGAEFLLDYYNKNIDPFVLSGSQTMVGKAGVIFGMGQLASAIGDMKAGKSLSQVWVDLSTSVSGMVGSTGLMMRVTNGVRSCITTFPCLLFLVCSINTGISPSGSGGMSMMNIAFSSLFRGWVARA